MEDRGAIHRTNPKCQASRNKQPAAAKHNQQTAKKNSGAGLLKLRRYQKKMSFSAKNPNRRASSARPDSCPCGTPSVEQLYSKQQQSQDELLSSHRHRQACAFLRDLGHRAAEEAMLPEPKRSFYVLPCALRVHHSVFSYNYCLGSKVLFQS